MAETVFRETIIFLQDLGVFEVVLPFLLVFTLIFAYLEKTKIFGTEKYKGDEKGEVFDLPRKNMNAMTAFTIAFFVVASSQLVSIISDVAANVVLVLLLVFSFTLVTGAFRGEQDSEGFQLEEPWTYVFQGISFVAIVLIFLNGLGWLDLVLEFFEDSVTNEVTAAAAFFLVLGGFVYYIVNGGPKPDAAKRTTASNSDGDGDGGS